MPVSFLCLFFLLLFVLPSMHRRSGVMGHGISDYKNHLHFCGEVTTFCAVYIPYFFGAEFNQHTNPNKTVVFAFCFFSPGSSERKRNVGILLPPARSQGVFQYCPGVKKNVTRPMYPTQPLGLQVLLWGLLCRRMRFGRPRFPRLQPYWDLALSGSFWGLSTQ